MAKNETPEEKEARKDAKKQAKADRRAKREGLLVSGTKPCDLCHASKDLLIRCIVDDTQAWRMVCSSCWKLVSGGVVDGDDDHPHYRYGGIWKNKSASSTVQSAKKPR